MRLSDTGRSAHPAIRPGTLRHYSLDEAALGAAQDLARGVSAAVAGATAGPFVVDSPTGTGRRFSDTVAAGLAEAGADAELNAAVLGDWTASVLVRLTAEPTGTDILWMVGGPTGDAVAAENFIATLRVLSDRRLSMFWEHGLGVNVDTQTTTYKLPLYKWVLVTVVKSATTGPGPGGTCTVTWYSNGYSVETTPGVVNASDGGSSVLRIGNQNVAGTPGDWPQADVDSFQFHAGVLDVDAIRDDVRRLHLLPFHVRSDLRVDVEDSEGVMRDLTNHNGLDWVDGVDVVDEVDQACTTATIRLLREHGSKSTAGLVTASINNLTDPTDVGSFAQLIAEGREVEVFAARLPLGLRATNRDWVSVFKGHVDDVEEASGEAVALQCRDQGGLLVDTYIEETIPYSDDVGSAVEGEMQAILNDNDNVLGPTSTVQRDGAYDPITLYTPVSPSWEVLQWSQRREGVLQALRTLAGQIGWECRYRWDPNPSAPQWRLTFYDPERERLDADVLLKPSDILDVTQFARSILGIRNVVRVVYASAETDGSVPRPPPTEAAIIAALSIPGTYDVRVGYNELDGEDQRMTAYVEIESSDSITLYGRRLFMEMAEGSTSQIDTSIEAAKMAYGALRDLEVAQLDKGITLPLLHELELNDLLIFAPNPQLFSGEQRLAVKRLTHTWGDACTTQVQLRGKPSVGWKRWLRLETRAGNGRPGVVSPADANADLPQGDLLKVVRNILDRTSYLKGGKFLQVRNGNFQSFSNGRKHEPDAWSMRAGAWGVDTDPSADAVADLTDQNSGNFSVRLKTVTAQLETDFIPCQADGNTPYSVQLTWKRGIVSTYYPRVDVEFYDVNKALIAGTRTLEPVFPFATLPSFQEVPNSANTWFVSRADGVRPPLAGTARFIKLVVRGSLTGAFTPLWVDDVALYRTGRELITICDDPFRGGNAGLAYFTVGGAPFVGVNAWFPVRLSSATYPTTNLGKFDWGNNLYQNPDSSLAGPISPSVVVLTGESLGVAGASGFLVREDGSYSINGSIMVLSSSNSNGQFTSLRIVKNATYNGSWVSSVLTPEATSNAQELIPIANFGNTGSAFPANTQRGTLINIRHSGSYKKNDRIGFEWYRGTNSQQLNSAGGSFGSRFQIKHEQVQ